MTLRGRRDEFDFDRLLAEAEARLAAAGHDRHRLHSLWCVEAGAIAAALASGTGAARTDGAWFVTWLAAAAVGLAAAAVLRVTVDRGLRRRVAMREQDMVEDVDRLRELFFHTAHQQGWDDGRIDATRRRLSRFPIEAEGFRWP